jgi:hypothetical protein
MSAVSRQTHHNGPRTTTRRPRSAVTRSAQSNRSQVSLTNMKREDIELLVQERLSATYIKLHCAIVSLISAIIIILQIFGFVYNQKANYAGSGFW